MNHLLATILIAPLLLPPTRAAEAQSSFETPGEALVRAGGAGDTAGINALLQKGLSVDATDRFGQTALLEAIKNNKIEAVKLLVAKGANLNGVDAMALPMAADQDNLDVARLLLENGANPDNKDGAGETAAVKSIDRGNMSMFRLLLEKGASPNGRNANGMPLLHLASISGNAEMVSLLLGKGATINAVDGVSSTALHVAAENGRTTVVDVLLAHHADIEARAELGFTPLFSASNACQAEAAARLLEHGASATARANGENGETPLHAAAHRGCPQVVRLLLDHGAEIESGDNDGFTPLLYAAEAGGVVHMRKDGIDVEKFPAVEVVNLLLDRGANIEHRANNGQTALHRAAFRDRPDAVKALLARGADIQAMDNFGNTPLSLVSESLRGFRRLVAGQAGDHSPASEASVDRIISDKQEIIQILEDALSKHPPTTFAEYVADLQNYPRDRTRRDHVVGMAAELPSLPLVPEQGLRLYARAAAIINEGTPAHRSEALNSLRGALNFAPWWGDAYFRLSQSLELDGEYELAIKNLDYFLELKPSEDAARTARIHLLELQGKLAESPTSARRGP